MSVRANLYKAVKSLITGSMPDDIRYVNQDLGQLEAYDPSKPNSRPPVTFPCVLINISAAKYEDLGCNQKIATQYLTLRLGFAPYSDTSNLAPDDIANLAIQYYDIEETLMQLMEDFNPSSAITELANITSSFTLLDDNLEERADLFIVRVLNYKIGLTITTTETKRTFTPVTITLNPPVITDFKYSIRDFFATGKVGATHQFEGQTHAFFEGDIGGENINPPAEFAVATVTPTGLVTLLRPGKGHIWIQTGFGWAPLNLTVYE